MLYSLEIKGCYFTLLTKLELLYFDTVCVPPTLFIQVKLKVYWEYVKAVGPLMSIFICFLYGAQSAAAIGANIWLTVWTNDTKHNNREDNVPMRVGVYAALGFTQGMAQVTGYPWCFL